MRQNSDVYGHSIPGNLMFVKFEFAVKLNCQEFALKFVRNCPTKTFNFLMEMKPFTLGNV